MSNRHKLRIATRGSELALWQANAIRRPLMEANPGLDCEVEVIRTVGDRVLDVPLSRIGDRGLFTKEVDEALLDGRADVAVHSLKDVPTRVPDGLTIGSIGRREDPADVLIARVDGPKSLDDLPQRARVGTSSLRRRAQLRSSRRDLRVVELRGNLNTRLAKLDAGDYDAIILAAAGVRRLGWQERITQTLPLERWVPAVGQGALAVVCRDGDADVLDLIRPLHDAFTATCVLAERSFLRYLEGGCQVPIGAVATLDGPRLGIDGLVSDLDGNNILRHRMSGPADRPEQLGQELALELVERGANEILRAVREEFDAPEIPAP